MKKVSNIFLVSVSFLIIAIHVLSYISKLNNFEDELIVLTSHIYFLSELEFKAPFLVDNEIFTPALTTGFNSSVGGAIGWFLYKDFYFSRLFNFIWLALQIFLFNFYLYKNKIIKIEFFYFSILGLFCIPLWYNSLYGLGEILSSLLFFNSLLLFKKNPNFSMLLMSISIFYGKFIIFLSFSIFVLINMKKQYMRSILYFFIPPAVWLLIIYLKTGISGLLNYLNRYIEFLFFHGVTKNNTSLTFFQEVKNNIALSEISDWSYTTLARVVIIPIMFSLFLVFKYLMKKNSLVELTISIIIMINYLYFFLFSYQKYLRYSQIFLVITIYYILFLLSSEKNLHSYEKLILIFFLSFYFSSEVLMISLIMVTFLSFRKKSIFNFLFIFLLLNILNLQYESSNYLVNNLNISECKENISSVACIKNYLPYDYEILD